MESICTIEALIKQRRELEANLRQAERCLKAGAAVGEFIIQPYGENTTMIRVPYALFEDLVNAKLQEFRTTLHQVDQKLASMAELAKVAP